MKLDEAQESLSDFLDGDTPCFLWGPPGVGKSDVVKQEASKRGWGLVDFRAPLRDAVDIRGLPSIDLKAKKSFWLAPDELPNEKRDGKEGIFFLDELNAASTAVQVACFGLVLDRKVGDYTLPDGWRVVAAGNEQKHRAAAQRMPTALANRFAHLMVEADAKVWCDWAYRNPRLIHPILPAFIGFREGLIFSMDGADLKAFPSPRSWAQVSKYINVKNSRRRVRNVEALVGEGPAQELEGFIEVYQNLPSLDDIIKDPQGADVPDQPAGKHAAAGAISRHANRSNFKAILTYAERLGASLEHVVVMDAVKRDESLAQTKTYIEFKRTHQHFDLT